MAEFADRFPDEFSGGMNQRASIVRALIHDPDLLLMDEPFGALDAITRDQIGLDFHQLSREEGKTVLFITHSISEAVFLSNRVIVMSPRPGKVEEIVPIELAARSAFRAPRRAGFSATRDIFAACSRRWAFSRSIDAE